MNSRTLKAITDEFAAKLIGRRVGKIFQLSRTELAFDLRLPAQQYLYINYSPRDPRTYLTARRFKDLAKNSLQLSPFAFALMRRTSNGTIANVRMRDDDRVIEFDIAGRDELGDDIRSFFIVQLTGRSANLFLADERQIIVERARSTADTGQQIGDPYSPPSRPGPLSPERSNKADIAVESSSAEPSLALDRYYSERLAEDDTRAVISNARSRLASEIRKREKLVAKLRSDLADHGDAENWKKLGDLLLANASSAVRSGSTVTVKDLFVEDEPELIIEVDENLSLTGAAEDLYRRYTKARNAAAEIDSRMRTASLELADFDARSAALEKAIAEGDLESIKSFTKPARIEGPAGYSKQGQRGTSSAYRTFVSSDGVEILVGKKAKDNDVLTFKIAKSLDTWMHAADYPGSHVVIRNQNRKDPPQQTLIEAAQLAAFYSQGRKQVKAAVHYTQKKFVNKPKGAAPGLVSLASFKTLLVVPEVPSGVTKAD